MIEIEISYDPVKMHTEIKMSSKVLKTPNHIQKYLTRPFPELLPRLPGFLHDVLNGFGFELKFTGSRVDYLSLEKTFLDAGIGPGLVRIIHVNPPPVSPGEKFKKNLKQLLRLFNENSHRLLKDRLFIDEAKEFLSRKYPAYVIIDNEDIVPEEIEATLFKIQFNETDDINKIEGNLKYIPILVYLNQQTVNTLPSVLEALAKRKDVNEKQIFFLFDLSVNKEQVLQEIPQYSAYGIENPIAIENFQDEKIVRYIEQYAFTYEMNKISGVVFSGLRQLEQEMRQEISDRDSQIQSRQEILDNAVKTIEQLDFIEKQFEYYHYSSDPVEFINLRNELSSELSYIRTYIQQNLPKILDFYSIIMTSGMINDYKIKTIRKGAEEIDERTTHLVSDFEKDARKTANKLKGKIEFDLEDKLMGLGNDWKYDVQKPSFGIVSKTSIPDYALTQKLANQLYVMQTYKNKWKACEDAIKVYALTVTKRYDYVLSIYADQLKSNYLSSLLNARLRAIALKEEFSQPLDDEALLTEDKQWFDTVLKSETVKWFGRV